MFSCWEYKFRDRPSFCEIVSFLAKDMSETFRERSFYYSEENQNVYYSSDEEGSNDEETAFTGSGAATPERPLRAKKLLASLERPEVCETGSVPSYDGFLSEKKDLARREPPPPAPPPYDRAPPAGDIVKQDHSVSTEEQHDPSVTPDVSDVMASGDRKENDSDANSIEPSAEDAPVVASTDANNGLHHMTQLC